MPGGTRSTRYFAKYQSAQSHLNAIIKALDSGQDELRKDNAAIETEKANMWAAMGKLTEYNTLATALDAAIESKVAELEAAGRTEDANTMRVRRALPDPAAPPGHHDADGRQRSRATWRWTWCGRTTSSSSRASTARRPRPSPRCAPPSSCRRRCRRQKLVLDQINALNTSPRTSSSRRPSSCGSRAPQINQQAASATIDVAEAAGRVRQRLRDDGRLGHLPGPGRRQHGSDRDRARGPDRAGQALPRAHRGRATVRSRPDGPQRGTIRSRA